MYHVTGKVVEGDNYGRKLGFPTANLDPVARERQGGHELLPGVYTGNAQVVGKKYKAAIVVNKEGRVEAHLLNFSGDVYGQEMSLEINKFIREYKTFATEKELIEQIKKDIDICSQE